MNVTLVQDSEHDIYDHYRHNQQYPEISERGLKRLGGAMETGADRVRQGAGRDLLDLRNRVTQREARLQIKGDCYCGKLAVMVDRLRTGFVRYVRQRVERNQAPGAGFEIQKRERLRIGLILRHQLEHDLVFIDIGIDGRYPARTVSVVQRIFDLVRIHSHGGGLVAVDLDVDLRALDQQIAGDVLQAGDLFDLFPQLLGRFI